MLTRKYPSGPGNDVAESFRSFNHSIANRTDASLLNRRIYESWPSRKLGQELLDYYFHELDYMYHIIHVPTVRKHFDSLCTSIQGHEKLNYAHVALIFTLFTLSAYLSSPMSEIIHPEQPEVHAWAAVARNALSVADCLAHPTLETLQSICLIGQYIMPNVGSISAMRILGATMIHSARTLLLHRVDTPSNKKRRKGIEVDWAEIEVKRRIWWHIASTDWYVLLSDCLIQFKGAGDMEQEKTN